MMWRLASFLLGFALVVIGLLLVLAMAYYIEWWFGPD
jgi:hypothetical protein